MNDDHDLIAALLAGDDSAEQTFVERYRRLAIGVACRRFGFDGVAADEIWQDLVIRIWASDFQALRAWRGEGRLSTYLAVIISHLCLRHRQRAARRQAMARPLDEAAGIKAETIAADDQVESDERARALSEAMSSLSSRDRLLLSLRFTDGKQPADIAIMLGLRPGAARKAIHDARKRLRAVLETQHAELFSADGGNDVVATDSHSPGGGE